MGWAGGVEDGDVLRWMGNEFPSSLDILGRSQFCGVQLVSLFGSPGSPYNYGAGRHILWTAMGVLSHQPNAVGNGVR
jgi:hypothetical protein